MTWLAPLGLLGLLSLPVIVLLHVLHARNRRAVVPTLALWRWLEREVRGPRMRLPPLSAVLLLQLSAAALLSLALARPRLDFLAGPATAERLVLVVDTSTSMSATDAAPSRLARAQAQAAVLLAGLGEGDSAALVSAGPQPQLLADTRQVGGAGVLAALTGLSAAGVGQDWGGALALAAAATLPEHHNRLVIYTDGAFTFPPALAAADYAATVEWVRVGGPQDNQAVITLAARPTGSGGSQLFARLANFAERGVDRTVTLLTDGVVFETHQLRLSAAGTVGQVWTLPPGITTVEVRLSGGDALPADDRAALGVLGARPVAARLVVAPGPEAEPGAVERALRAIPGLTLAVSAPADYNPFEPYALTVFDGWLPEAWPAGGVLVFDPPPGAGLLLVSGVAGVEGVPRPAGEALFVDVALEHVFFNSTATLQAPAWLSPALSDAAGRPLVWRGVTSGSRVVVFGFALDATNLPRRAGFPVLVANAVNAVLPPALPASLRPGDALPLPAPELLPQLTVTDPSGAQIGLVANRAADYAATSAAGLYLVQGTLASGEDWKAWVGVNAGALEESDLRAPAQPDFVQGRDQAAGNKSDGLELWPLLAALAALVLVAEAWVAWR